MFWCQWRLGHARPGLTFFISKMELISGLNEIMYIMTGVSVGSRSVALTSGGGDGGDGGGIVGR